MFAEDAFFLLHIDGAASSYLWGYGEWGRGRGKRMYVCVCVSATFICRYLGREFVFQLEFG